MHTASLQQFRSSLAPACTLRALRLGGYIGYVLDRMRESTSPPVAKCICERLPYPTRSGGLEKAFIEWAQADSSVEAFCKISENRHTFARLRYVKEDGLPAF